MPPLATFCFVLLANVVLAQHVNIEVAFHSRDVEVLKEARLLAATIGRDNRFAVAEVTEKDCDGAAQVECTEAGAFIRISSLGTSVDGTIGGSSKLQQQIQRHFAEFVDKFYMNQAVEKDDVEWWNNRFAAPHAKHLQKLERFIAESTDQPTYVLYYRKEGYENFAAYYACAKLFQSDAVRGLVVDCSDEESICNHQSIDHTPALIAYSNGKVYKEYQHEIDAKLIHDWILTIAQPVITRLTEDAVPYYRDGGVPGFDSPRPSVVIFFASTRKSDIYKNYKRFARERHGDFHLTELIDRGIEKWAHQPVFVAMKPLETISKANTLYEDISYESMVEFIEENQHPSVHGLTDISALLTALSLDRPMMVFFDPSRTKNITQFATVAADYALRSKVAVFAASEGLRMPGLYLAKQLGIDTTTPQYVYVNRINRCLNTKPITKENEMEIERWLKSAGGLDCKPTSEIDMDTLRALRNWERRDNLRRELQERLSPEQHEEL